MIFELERTKPGTRTLIAKGRVVTLTHGEPLKVFLNAEQCAAFSNTAGVTVTPAEEPKLRARAATVTAEDETVKEIAQDLRMDQEEVAASVRRGAKKGRN